ncbi:hypothetical protein [Tropicimonas isoalkanivorans]|uniref:Uncharacterized protein n=1 Tax=Tropicimonas isoalkanivorans TaxID=441112 RepID=A0A1I1LKK5_9RHOB|nr:hypothetical protein [Tropicimonas isoalkanivorans]SFC73092.1 hypothetical protein SAMN04488094_108152 [Tropicimonas isoalkanivorans]
MRRSTGFTWATAMLLAGLSISLSTGSGWSQEVSPIVWKGEGTVWLRDPNVFRADGGTYILSGTNSNIIEYPDVRPGTFNADDGTPYRIRLFSPNGKRLLRKSGFNAWGKKFFRSSDGVVLIASLQQASDFDRDEPKKRGRSVYVFEPRGDTRRTEGGFPLDWKMRDNTPMIKSTYNGDPFVHRGNVYVYIDDRRDLRGDDDWITCIRVQQVQSDLVVQDKGKALLCPGRKVPKKVDKTGWDRARPMPSEIRLESNGSLIEGAWGYASPNGTHFLLYSAGAYRSESNYGGFVAVCASPMAGCEKVLRSDGSDVRPFVAESSKNYTHIGRPFPVTDGDGKLVDIIFHARQRGSKESGDKENDILRCTNFTPDILEKFVLGGPACEFDDVRN